MNPADTVPLFRRILALTDRYLDRDSRILDFGCGSGKVVYEFRDAGFDACGFDIHDYVQLRSPGDRRFFDVANQGVSDNSVMTVDWNRYCLPYDDGTFDVVLSFETLEHVLNLDAVIRELARVTKQDGIGIHIFPSKYRLLEAHTFVPFGGMTKSFRYNLFWAALGVRNRFQKGLSAVETAALNAKYARTGTNYPAIREIQRIGRRHFGRARFAPQLRQAVWTNYWQYRHVWRFTKPALIGSTLFKDIFWVLECPKSAQNPPDHAGGELLPEQMSATAP